VYCPPSCPEPMKLKVKGYTVRDSESEFCVAPFS
jgi:hypothetical protein